MPIAPLKAKSKVTLLNSTWDLARHFIWDGVIHILLGFDHVLFVLTLIVVARRFRQLLLILTAFTIGHSVTLILSTLDIVSLPPAPVEALIALTIVYTALENIIKADEGPRHRAWLTFLFGLIHGVGFSYVLRESLNLAGSARVSALLFFNVGVELGQLAIVFVLYPYILLSLSKTWYRNVMKGSSAVIFLVALFWLVERTLVLLGI